MEKIIISFLIIISIVIVGCICTDISVVGVEATNGNRFVKIQDWGSNFTFYDNTTKVQYYYGNGGITVLVDADGKPLLYEGD